MLKSFIEHIQKTTQPALCEVDGGTFVLWADGRYQELIADENKLSLPETLTLHSLDALVQMVKTEALKHTEAPVYVTVPDHLSVRCYGQPEYDAHCERPILYEAKATDVPGWADMTTLPFEEMQIALRTRFEDQETQDMIYTRQLLSEISTGAKIVYNDNGIATSVVSRKGVDLQTNQTIKPFVTLRPYRTFQEIEQPASMFLIRISERGISLIGADGGMWKLHARETIKAYLAHLLEEEIQNGRVVLAL